MGQVKGRAAEQTQGHGRTWGRRGSVWRFGGGGRRGRRRREEDPDVGDALRRFASILLVLSEQ